MAHLDECSSVDRHRPDPLQAIILAAGKGVRMGGDLPKVIYPIADQPMISWIIKACLGAGVRRCIVVVGYRGEDVRRALANQTHCVFVEQREQLGTGHATQMAEPLFDVNQPTDVLVLPGDGPLITPRTLAKLIATHRRAQAAATLATSILDNPDGYGRVIRNPDGSFQAIVEQKDATDAQKQVPEINTGYYCFRSDKLFDNLSRVSATNAQGEYYLTDVPGMLRQMGQTVALVDAVAPQEVMGVNSPAQQAQVDQILRARLARLSDTDSDIKERA